MPGLKFRVNRNEGREEDSRNAWKGDQEDMDTEHGGEKEPSLR